MIVLSRSCTQKKEKIATKIVYVQDEPQPNKFYTVMPVMPVTNSVSVPPHTAFPPPTPPALLHSAVCPFCYSGVCQLP